MSSTLYFVVSVNEYKEAKQKRWFRVGLCFAQGSEEYMEQFAGGRLIMSVNKSVLRVYRQYAENNIIGLCAVPFNMCSIVKSNLFLTEGVIHEV